MNKSTKSTKDYKNKLSANIKEFTKYLQFKTGYEIVMTVELDKSLGYVYKLNVSLDNFETFATIIVSSVTKAKLLQELKLQIPKLNFQDKRRVHYSRKNTTGSSKIWCCNCESEKHYHANFHRNVHSRLFSSRGGYVYLCFDCAYERAAEIYRDNDGQTAIAFICGQFDRPYIKKLADEIVSMDLSPIEKFGEYMRRISLVPSMRKKEITFALSDLFN